MGMRPDGKLVFSVGASRSGKTQYVLTQVKSDKRLLVWDVEGEYAAKYGLRVIEGKQALLNFAAKTKGAARVAYHPRNLKEYDFFCRCAFIWAMVAPCSIVGEELAASTNSGKASGWWGVLVSRGLKYGPHIYGVAQRAQEIDKSLLGNATIVNICRPNTTQDAQYIADRFGLQLSDIPDSDLEMLQRNKNRTLKKSKIRFRGKKPYMAAVQNFTSTF